MNVRRQGYYFYIQALGAFQPGEFDSEGFFFVKRLLEREMFLRKAELFFFFSASSS